MAYASRYSLNIPYPQAKTEAEHHDNYREIQRWADRFIKANLGTPWYLDTLEIKEWGGYSLPIPVLTEYWVGVLLESGTSTTTLHLNRDGSSIASVSWASGEDGIKITKLEPPVFVDADTHVLTAELTAIGTGARGVTGAGRFV